MTSYNINFTKTNLNKIIPPCKDNFNSGGIYDTYKDIKEKGLVLLVSNGGAKTFYLYTKVNGKPERIKLGNYPVMSIEQARKAAIDNRSIINSGKNPNEEKNKLKSEITFGVMFNEFMERYSKKYKKTWIYDEREVNKFLSHWYKRKASAITKHEIQNLHEKIRDENGLYQANRLLERIRAIFNKAIEWGWQGINPSIGIKKFKEKSRDRFIQPDELPKFFKALEEDLNPTIKDYIWISLLTGARKTNVLSMRFQDINFSRKEWKIPETKNGESVTVPLVDKAINILKKRAREIGETYVFSSNSSSKGYLQEPKRAWKRILKNAGIKDLRIHDLRRTLGSYQAISGTSLAIIGKSLGHKSSQATEIYARMNLDPVRQSLEKATSIMMSLNEEG